MAGFGEIIGHEQIIAHLQSAVAQDKISHAYIFDGPDHAGKRLLADAFAMTLQCEAVREGAKHSCEKPEPCMRCRSCRQAISHNQPDILYLTHEKPNTISVDDVRTRLNGDVDVRPYASRYKVYIVDEAEKMNVQAQNALLKTIEEPPAYVVILLLTTNADLFLPTIRSRCITLELKAVADERIRSFLMRERRIPDYRADVCVAFAQGNVGRAVMLAESDRFNEQKDYAIQLIRRLPSIRNYDLLRELEPLHDFKEEIRDFFDLLLFWYRDVLLYKASRQEKRLIFKEYTHEIRQQAERCSYAGLEQITGAIREAEGRVRANVNFELTMELLFLTIKENIR